MHPVRFIHAADLHLDAVFQGLCREAPFELIKRLHEATFTATQRLFDLCEAERPDILLLAGDITNQEDRSLRAMLMLHERCRRLGDLGVRVFMVHGNHDPYPARLKSLHWPANVTVFGEEPASVPCLRDGEPIAVVHGASHASARETRNLAALMHRTDEPCLHIGLLHTTLGAADGETRYAPCSLDDLTAAGMHYWALGHVHEHQVLAQAPLIVYPGALQGLHILEQGNKGCCFVTATPEGAGFRLTTSFKPLGPVAWQGLELEADPGPAPDPAPQDPAPQDPARQDADPQDDAACLARLEARLSAAMDEAAAAQWPSCEALILRLTITGRTALDAFLRRPATQAVLLERLREARPAGPLVFVKDLFVRTRPVLDRERLADREDLLGEIVRAGDDLRSRPDAFAAAADAALADLFEHPRARKALTPLSDEELRRLLDDAESLCMDLLEND